MEHLDELVAVHAPLLTKNLTGDSDNLLVEAYLRQVRHNRAATALLLEERLKRCFERHQTKDPSPTIWQNELTDVLAVSRVSDMFLAECEAEILSRHISGDLIRPQHRDRSTAMIAATNDLFGFGGIAREVAQKVFEWALEKLLPLLQASADAPTAPEAVKHLVALLKAVSQGKFDKNTLENLLQVMKFCVDLVPAGPISIALKVALVALQKLLDLM